VGWPYNSKSKKLLKQCNPTTVFKKITQQIKAISQLSHRTGRERQSGWDD